MNPSSSNKTDSSTKDYFKLLREQIVHEDDLINNRTNWLLGFQGLLFTAYGILFNTTTKSCGNEEALGLTDDLINIIAIVGIFVSVITILSVCGAVIVMCQTKKEWRNWIKRESSQSTKEKYPRVMATCCPMVLGLIPPFGIPSISIWAWIMVMCKLTSS